MNASTMRKRHPTPSDWHVMTNDITFSITTTRFDEDYAPAENSRVTTNFANLARGEGRRQNLRNALSMMDRRLNELLSADARYRVELDIVSVQLAFADGADDEEFPVIDVRDGHIVETHPCQRQPGHLGYHLLSPT